MNTQTSIVATKIPEDKRLDALPHFFGVTHMMKAEHLVYTYMSKLCADYHGGYWEFYTLSNGGFYMAPVLDRKLPMAWDGNGYSGTMSDDAAGITAMLFALNHLAFEHQSEAMSDLYYQLRDFAIDHPESDEIMSAID